MQKRLYASFQFQFAFKYLWIFPLKSQYLPIKMNLSIARWGICIGVGAFSIKYYKRVKLHAFF